MGTVVDRKRKDGSIAYMAQITKMRDGKVFRKTATFDRKAAAENWIRKLEADLEKPGGFEKAKTAKHNPTLLQAIDRYISESRARNGRTKSQVLNFIRSDLGAMQCADIRSHDIHCRKRTQNWIKLEARSSELIFWREARGRRLPRCRWTAFSELIFCRERHRCRAGRCRWTAFSELIFSARWRIMRLISCRWTAFSELILFVLAA